MAIDFNTEKAQEKTLNKTEVTEQRSSVAYPTNITTTKPNTKKALLPMLIGSVLGLLVGAGATYAIGNKTSIGGDEIIQPTNLSEGEQATVTQKKMIGDFVVWEVADKNGAYKYYPIADKKGEHVILGTVIDVKTNKPIFDSSVGEEVANEGESTEVSNNTSGTATPVDTGEPIPVSRWGSTFSKYGLDIFQANHSGYEKGIGLPEDYFTKNMVGTGDKSGYQAAGAGEFKKDLNLFSRHIAEIISREAAHNGLKNKDAMENPQNYVWIFHRYDCGFCRQLINAVGEKGNIIYIPMVNNSSAVVDGMTDSNTVKSFAQLDGLHTVYQLENMKADAVKLKGDNTEEDLEFLRYNTNILSGIHSALDAGGYEVNKDKNGQYVFGTPTAVYFDRDTGDVKISYMMASAEERQRVLGF